MEKSKDFDPVLSDAGESTEIIVELYHWILVEKEFSNFKENKFAFTKFFPFIKIFVFPLFGPYYYNWLNNWI